YRVRLPVRAGRGHAAGGHRLGHRTDPAPAQGRALQRSLQGGAYQGGRSPARRQRGVGGARPGSPGRTRGGCDRRRACQMTLSLAHFLALGAILFALSVVGIFLNRRNVIVMLMSIELMLLAVNINFIAFSHFLGDAAGQVFVFFIMTVAAAESAIGLAILVVLFRKLDTVDAQELDSLKG